MQTIKCSPPYALIDVIKFEFPAVCRSEVEITPCGAARDEFEFIAIQNKWLRVNRFQGKPDIPCLFCPA
jgi:hypothetical protein